MTNFLTLLKIRYKEDFSFVRLLILTTIYIGIFITLCKLSQFIGRIGLSSILPITGYIMTLVITFLVVILSLNDLFSGNEDSEYLLSTPIGIFSQVMVMFVRMYIKNLLYTILIQVPFLLGYISYGGSISMIKWVIGLLFTSLPICGIATLIGMVILLSLARNNHKNLIMSILTILSMIVAIIILIVVIDRIYLISTHQVHFDASVVSQSIIQELSKNLKFARFYQYGIVQNDIGYLLLFIFMSVIWYGVLLFMHTMAYQTVITALHAPNSHGIKTKQEVLNKMHMRSPYRTLIHKELSQLLGSKAYLTHISLGMILALILPINFMIIGTDHFLQYKNMIPILLCILIGISNISYCSLSFESKRYWIVSSAPIDHKLVIKSKGLVNILFILPIMIISSICFSIAFKCSIDMMIINIIISILYTILITLYGLYINSIYRNYYSETESIILHLSQNYILGYLPGILLPLIILIILLYL